MAKAPGVGVTLQSHFMAALAALAIAVAAPASLQAQSGSFNPHPDLNDLNNVVKKWKGLDKIAKDLADKSKKTDDLLKNEPFTKDDAENNPDPDPAGQPLLPATCKDDEECEKCFVKPYALLQNTRVRFEKLRGIYHHTVTGINDALAWGDNAANLAGGMAALAWMKEKQGVRASLKNLDDSYDGKYAELVATLKEALDGISQCEEQVFGEVAWYDRFGFIYYQFMADRYRRR